MKKAKRRVKPKTKIVVEPTSAKLVTALTFGASSHDPETILLFYDDGSIEKIEPIHIGKFERTKLIETLKPTPLK